MSRRTTPRAAEPSETDAPQTEAAEAPPPSCATCGQNDRDTTPMEINLSLGNSASLINRWPLYVCCLFLCDECKQTMVRYTAGPPDPWSDNRRWYAEHAAFVARLHVAMVENVSAMLPYTLGYVVDAEKTARMKARRR